MRSVSFALMVILIVISAQHQAFGEDQVGLVWDANVEPDFSHYLVYRCDSLTMLPAAAENLIAAVEAPFYFDDNIQAGHTYYYWVTAVDLYGNQSSCSGPLQVDLELAQGALSTFTVEHFDEDQDPNDPFVDRTLDNDNIIEFFWTPSSLEGAFYKVYVSQNQDPEVFVTDTDQNAFLIEDTMVGQTYRLRVDVIGSDQQPKTQGFSEHILCTDAIEEVARPGIPEALNIEQ